VDINDGTDLAALHQAIVDVAAAAFPGVHFQFYRDEEDRKNLPLGTGTEGDHPRAYVLLELSELEAAERDPGTEQQAMLAKFEAEVVVKSLQADAKVKVRVLAGSLAAFLRKQLRFRPADVLQGEAKVVGCYRDDFSPELDKYEVWRVEWLQEVWLGEGVWRNDGTRPAQVLFSYVPIVGIPFEPDYMDATGAPRA
jgi:hypothetical protein